MIGVSHGPHSVYSNIAVVVFAAAFVDGERGMVPEVGTRSAPGTTTRASTARKTEESFLSGDDSTFVIESDNIIVNDPASLKLIAKGKILTLSHSFNDGGKMKKKNFQVRQEMISGGLEKNVSLIGLLISLML